MRYLWPALAVLGLVGALYAAAHGSRLDVLLAAAFAGYAIGQVMRERG